MPNCLMQIVLTYVRTLHLVPLNLAVNYQRLVAPFHDLAEQKINYVTQTRNSNIWWRQRVPPCASCHDPSDLPRNAAYPKLAGQYADYLKLQLELFNKGHRGGTAYGHLMRRVAANLTSQQIGEVALYYSSLTPESQTQDKPK